MASEPILRAGAAAAESRATGTAGASLFFWLSITMAAIIFLGFGISYFAPMAAGTAPAIPPITHVHGAFFFSWMLLLVYQAELVRRRRIASHRAVGLLGIALGSGATIFGALVTVLFARSNRADASIYGFTYISVVSVVAFTGLLTLAIRNVHRPEGHRRYILLATGSLVIGGLNRIYGSLLALQFDTFLSYVPQYLTVDALILAIVVGDWRTSGSVHRATAIGAAVNIVPQVFHAPIVGSQWFVGFTRWLASLAHFH
jgi:hypothetical protein